MDFKSHIKKAPTGYTLTSWYDGKWHKFTAYDILTSLDPTTPLQKAHILAIVELLKNGEQYSGQSDDVLSGAFRAIGKTEIPDYSVGWVNSQLKAA